MPGKALWTVRGGLSLREGRRRAGKCDNLSFLRVFLLRMGGNGSQREDQQDKR